MVEDQLKLVVAFDICILKKRRANLAVFRSLAVLSLVQSLLIRPTMH